MSGVLNELKHVLRAGLQNLTLSSLKKSCLLLVVVLLTGCALAPGQQIQLNEALPPPIHGAKIHLFRIDKNIEQHSSFLVKPGAYRIGPEDVLNIVVWDHPELTIPAGAYRTPQQSGIEVQQNGDIYYPFVGSVHVAGLTVAQLRRLLIKRLAKYIRQPQISVRLAAFNSKRIQVMGEVMKPQVQAITNIPLSLMTAINHAGGINPNTANPNKVFVIRAIHHKVAVFVLDANDPSALLIAEHFYLKNRDVVYVAPAGVATWNRVITNLVPAVTTGYYLDEIVRR